MPIQQFPPLVRRLYSGQMMAEEQINHKREYDRLWHRLKLANPVEREKNKLRCKRYYETHKDHHRDYDREYRKIHKDELYYKEYNRQRAMKWREKNPEKSKEVYKKHNKKLKLLALQLISKMDEPHCVRCGCADLRVLEINHKNGNGTKDISRYTGRGSGFNRAIVKGIRKVDDLEVLCRVCNAWHYVEQKFGLKYHIEFLKGGADA